MSLPATPTPKFDTFYKYDGAGRLILTAEPSAVTGYDETKSDLLNNVSGNYFFLSDHSGLVETTDYSPTTTATATKPGDVAGYERDTKIQQGELGAAILQTSTQYSAHSVGGFTIYVPASDSVYRNSDGSGQETTSYSYSVPVYRHFHLCPLLFALKPCPAR